MSEQHIIKIQCPLCAGKIGMELGYFRELAGQVIKCPHCQGQFRMPETIPGSPPSMQGPHSVDRTQQIQKTGEFMHVVPPVPKNSRPCPHCGVDIGPRDRICVICGGRIPG